MSTARNDVEKFNGMIDYNLWKEKILANLELMGLTEALKLQEEELDKKSNVTVKEEEDETKEKETKTDNDDKKTTDLSMAEKQRKVRSMLILSLADTILRKVIVYQSAAEMLRKLDSMFMSKSLPNRIYLKQKLYGFKMKDSLTVEGNIDEFQKIIIDLSNVKVNVLEEDQAILLLMSLPKQFDQLRDCLRYGKSTITFDEVVEAIHSKQLELNELGKGIKPQGEGLNHYRKIANLQRP